MSEPAVERRAESGHRPLTAAQKSQFVEALTAAAAWADGSLRSEFLAEVRDAYQHSIALPDDDANVRPLTVFNQCLRADGLAELVSVLDLIDSGRADPAVDRFRRLRSDLLTPEERVLRPVERTSILGIITRLAPDDVRRMAGVVTASQAPDIDHAGLLGYLENVADDRDIWPVLEFLERLIPLLSSGDAERSLASISDQIGDRVGQRRQLTEFRRSIGNPTPDNDPAHIDAGSTPDGSADGDPGDDMQKTERRGAGVSATRPAVWGGVPQRIPSFIGRRELLSRLRGYLGPGQASVALLGQGGVGKTQIATEFAHQPGASESGTESSYDLVWWIESDTENAVRRSFDSLARRIGEAHSLDRQNVVDVVLDVLRRDERYKRWLLIYDNADDPDMLRSYLPVGVGHVLITTRNRLWQNQVDSIDVDVFDSEDSTALLQHRWSGISDTEAGELADDLGHLPLALNQAAAYHEESGIPLDSYRRLLATQPTRLLNAGRAAGYPDSVAKTVQASVDRLGDTSPGALQLFTLCAFLSSQPIAVAMLTRGRLAKLPAELAPLATVIKDDVDLRAAVREIVRLGLAGLDTKRDFITIHTLVRTLIMDGLQADQQAMFRRAAHEVLALANPGEPDRPANWPQFKQIAPHIEPSGIINAESDQARWVVIDLVRYHYNDGDYPQSRELAEHARAVWSERADMGPMSLMTLLIGRHLGNALRALGEYGQAKELDDETLAALEETLGPTHEHTLAVAMGVGADFRLIGNFDGALAHDQAVYQQLAQASPSEMTTLRAKNNLAIDHRLLGNYTEALRLDEENLATRTAEYGVENARTLFSKLAIARDLYGLGRYRDGLTMQRLALSEYDRYQVGSLDDRHLAQMNLAILLRKAGRTTEAVEQARRNYEEITKRNGPDHERSLASAMALVDTLRFVATNPVGRQLAVASGALTEAAELSEQTLGQYRLKFNATHPFTLACAVNHAIVLRAVGNHADATSLDELTIASLQAVLGPTHPYTLCCVSNMSNNRWAAGDIDAAATRATLEASQKRRRPGHLNTIGLMYNLALDVETTGDSAEAKRLRVEALGLIAKELGPDHPETVSLQAGNRYEADVEPPLT